MQTRQATVEDATTIRAIYGHYVETTTSTFEFEIPTVAEVRHRIVQFPRHPWLVALDAAEVIGYAYACPFENREGYRFTVETSIYLREGCVGRGNGQTLYSDLLSTLKDLGFVRAVARIALPNPRSQRLHERLGYRKVAHFEKIGHKFDQWIDVGYWQRTL